VHIFDADSRRIVRGTGLGESTGKKVHRPRRSAFCLEELERKRGLRTFCAKKPRSSTKRVDAFDMKALHRRRGLADVSSGERDQQFRSAGVPRLLLRAHASAGIAHSRAGRVDRCRKIRSSPASSSKIQANMNRSHRGSHRLSSRVLGPLRAWNEGEARFAPVARCGSPIRPRFMAQEGERSSKDGVRRATSWVSHDSGRSSKSAYTPHAKNR